MNNKEAPAFPGQFSDTKNELEEWVIGEKFTGLSKREYFACHAPIEIPAWFTHTKTERPTEPKRLNIHDPFFRETHDWHSDQCYDLPEELQWYQQAWEKYWGLMSEWNRLNTIEKYFQLRYFFADMLLDRK